MASSDHQDMRNTLSGIMGQFCNAATQQDFDAAMADWNEVYAVAETMGLYLENCDVEDEAGIAEERIERAAEQVKVDTMFQTDQEAIQAFIDAEGNLPANDEQMVSPSLQMISFNQTRGLAMDGTAMYVVRIDIDSWLGPEFPALRGYGISAELSLFAAEYANN